jgi:hypothetical protein
MDFDNIEDLLDFMEMVEYDNSFGKYTIEEYEELMNEITLMYQDMIDFEEE